MIIGIAGKIGAGKSVVAEMLVKKLKAKHIRFADILEEIMDYLNLPHERKTYQDLGAALRKVLGAEVIIDATLTKVKKVRKRPVILEAIRTKDEYRALRKFRNSKFIFVDASIGLRLERTKKRKEKAGEARKTLAEFQKEDSRLSEREIASLKKYADFVIENDGSREELEEKISSIWQ